MSNNSTFIKISLSDPGMTAMHRAGIAGLAMTLDNLKQPETPRGLSWSISKDSILLNADSFEDLSTLIKIIFEQGLHIGKDGIIDFIGLRGIFGQSLNADIRLETQKALLGTFLQHGKSRKLEQIESNLILDPDKNTHPDTYRPLVSFNHQSLFSIILKQLPQNTFTPIIGWALPGAVEKHPGQEWSRLEASPTELIALAFAPVGCIPYIVQDRRRGSRSGFALLIPQIDDLKNYINLRKRVSSLCARELTVTCSSDAALRLALFNDEGLRRAKRQNPTKKIFCTAVTFGVQIWSKQQKTRSSIVDIYEPSESVIYNYKELLDINEFTSKRLKSKSKIGTWVQTSPARSAITESLVKNQPWWQEIANSYLTNPEFRKAIIYEREGLNKMIKRAHWDHEQERLFVEVCHEAMRVLYASIAERAREQNTNFSTKAETEFTKIRSSLLRSKNADNCRDALIQFWSKASRDKVRFNKILRQSRAVDGTNTQPVWLTLLPFLDDKNWKKARDLALLALISYASHHTGEQNENPEEVTEN